MSGRIVIGAAAVWNTTETGTQPADNDTLDLTATVYNDAGDTVATRKMRGTYTRAADTIAVTPVTTTGEATVFEIIDDKTKSVFVEVTHFFSGEKGALAWSFVDETVAGVTPASGGGK